MKENIKDYFYFSRSEKNGLFILLVIILFLIIFPYFYNFLKPIHLQEFNSPEIEEFTQSLTYVDEPNYQSKLDQYIIERYDSLKLFFFNPNNTPKEKFIQLGLTEQQVKTISNFLKKGGKFRVKGDFAKIYGIREQQFQILEPYILLPDDQYAENSLKKGMYSGNLDEKEELFTFNPNTSTDEEFKKLGLSDNLIKTIRNYLNKVGKFKSKEEFKKVYGLSEEKYNQLEPYISIHQANIIVNEKIIIELNSATPEDLIEIKGIGKSYAEAICKYRQKLGGYYSIDQILEIKGIDPANFKLFKENIRADRLKITFLNLNFAETEELAAHPYLNYYQAKEIVKFRSTNGPFRDKVQLLENKILMEQTFKKVEPYLTINE